MKPSGIKLTTSRLRQHRQLQLSSTFASYHCNFVKKQNHNDKPEAALDNWQPVWNAQVSISTSVCINFELRPGSNDTHICWFNFYALTQGNVYKSIKEQIKYRGHTETGWQAGRQLLFWMDETWEHATVHWQQGNVLERIAWWVWA